MYEAFYRLDRSIFRLMPEYRHRYVHRSYENAYADLIAATRRGDGFVVLTAAPGLGKTTLVDELADELGSEGYPVGKVASTQVNADDLLKLVGFTFGLEADAFGKPQLLNGLERLLGGERRGPGPALLIVDEAHHLPASALEELKLLRNLAADGEPIIQIFLCGQERLWETLHRPECEQIRQLILGSASLSPLSAGETRDYIGHALRSAGWAGDPEIGADALRLLHAHTRGVPRLINLTMGHLLLHGSLNEAHVLDARDVELVLAQLGPEARASPVANGLLSFGLEPAETEALLCLDARAAESDKPAETHRGEAPALPVPVDHGERAGSRAAPTGVPVKMGSALRKMKQMRAWLLPAAIASALAVTFAVRFGPELQMQEAVPERGEMARVVADPAESSEELRPVESFPPADTLSPFPLGPAQTAHEASISSPATQAGNSAASGSQTRADATQHASAGGRTQAAPQDPLAQTPAETATNAPDSANASVPASGDQGDSLTPFGSEVDALLTKAERARSENRLTLPAGDNSLDYYRAVLDREPDNAPAKAGIEGIADRYLALARDRLSRGDRKGARIFASRGLAIRPGDSELENIARVAPKKRVKVKRLKKRHGARHAADGPQTAPAPAEPDLLTRVTDWLRSNRTDSSPFLDQ